jgi:CheY-like chemotaxis protein
MKSACLVVIDDHPTNLKLVRAVLEEAGYEIFPAADAAEGRRLIAQHRPDLLLLDLAMPGMDGFALARLLRADPATAHLPIVALTASAMKGDEEKARSAGCDGYITKPIDSRALPGQIAGYLARAADTKSL